MPRKRKTKLVENSEVIEHITKTEYIETYPITKTYYLTLNKKEIGINEYHRRFEIIAKNKFITYCYNNNINGKYLYACVENENSIEYNIRIQYTDYGN